MDATGRSGCAVSVGVAGMGVSVGVGSDVLVGSGVMEGGMDVRVGESSVGGGNVV